MPEYPRVKVDELPDAPNPTAHKKEVDEALGIDSFGFNVYVARPGERLPWGYHYHPDHEELLYVLEGELAVETPATRSERDSTNGENGADRGENGSDVVNDGTDEDGRETLHIGAGEALFVPPGAPQCARAAGEGATKVIAVGAPKDSDGSVIEEYCPACETVTDRTYEERESKAGTEDDGGRIYVLFCAACGTETDRLEAGSG